MTRHPLRSRRSDRELHDRLRTGDPDVLRGIVDDYRPLLFAYLTSTLGNRADAEDVLQQCLIEVWRNADKFDPNRGSVRTWLLTICRSRAVDHLRRRVPEPRDPAVLSAVEPSDGGEEMDAVLDQWRVVDLLRRLPSHEAELLRLRFYEGLSQQQIAQRTKMPIGTVKTSMVRALRRLRALLDEEAQWSTTGP